MTHIDYSDKFPFTLVEEIFSDHTDCSIKPFNIKKVVKWSEEEDAKLISCVKVNKRNGWVIIAENFKNKTSVDCLKRYKLIRPNIIKGRWRKEEDEFIEKKYEELGPKWSKISKLMSSRTGKQIRERFMNRLDSKVLKTPFSLEEDIQLLKLQAQYGNKWKIISKFLPGRSVDNIKNRFNSAIKQNKKILLFLERRDFGISIEEQKSYLYA